MNSNKSSQLVVKGNKLNLKWIKDIIGQDYKTWRKGDIVLIQAQTGTGKTYFIKDVLIDTLEENEKILFVCNRTNLKRQLKKDLLKKFNLEIPDTLEKLDKTTVIKNITITSYHALQYSARDELYDGKQFDLSRYSYIVLDECHYIMSDGSFNNKTRFAFEKLIKNGHHQAVTIFISATMEEVKKPVLFYAEKGFFGEGSRTHRYETGIDYSYVKAKYFKDIINIINLIKNDNTDDKWLVFVSDLKVAAQIKKELKKGVCSIIKAGTQSDELESIIENSKFENKVLVTTKAMDNGINIDDPLLTNIVIMTWDRISFIQMLGRKRINIENAQQINLYIPTKYKKSFLSKIQICDKKLAEIDLLYDDRNEFNKKYDNSLNEIGSMNDIFYRDKTTKEWKVNPIGDYRLRQDKEFAEYMVKIFDNQDKFAFVLEQLRWLKLENTFDECNFIEDVLLKEDVETLGECLNNLTDQRILAEEQMKLKEMLTNEAFKIDRSLLRGVRRMHPHTFNSILQNTLKLPYEVVATRTSERDENGKPKKYTYWTINKKQQNVSQICT